MDKKYWTCLNCKRKFATKNQGHACVNVSVADHFKDKPKVVRELYNHLLKSVRKFGPVRVDTVQTAINFSGRRGHFAMIYIQKQGLLMDFALPVKVVKPRIERRQKIGSRYIHYVKIKSKRDINKELLSWLNEAYQSEV